MFSLIITIISIALVAALALATIYYGGTAFNRGSDNAVAAQLINEGQQINGAVTMNAADGAAGAAGAVNFDRTGTTALTVLSPAYLAQVPAGWTHAANVAMASHTAVTQGVCNAVNARAGIATAPTDAAAFAALPNVYGCSADLLVHYKF